ncbi:type I phosphoribosyltransferase [Kribbella monticola]|uniref:hypothetical protein n=1 Tax=Kribbella monticola TaxID=2185285 RepID=UPI000DD49DAD|nr:hypothetical protein [Kribbella monticola]
MTFDIKQELARTLDNVEPMPDLIPAVLARGPRMVRRQRVLLGTGAVLSSLAVVAGGLTIAPLVRTEPPVTAPASTLPPIPEVIGYNEFLRYAAETLSALLPEQFDAVQVDHQGGLTVEAGGLKFPITFELSEPMADFPAPGTRCAAPATHLKGNYKIEPDHDACQVKQLATGGLAVVRLSSASEKQTTKNGVVTLEPTGPRTATLNVDHHGLGLRLAIFPDQGQSTAPITGDQLLAMASDQRMTQLLDVWSTHLSSTYQWVNKPTTPPTPR